MTEQPLPADADLDAASAVYDEVLTRMGPPPGWSPPTCGCTDEIADATCPDHGVLAFFTQKFAEES